MKYILRLYSVAHGFMALLFAGAGLLLIGAAARAGWQASGGDWDHATSEAIIEAVGVLAAAVVAMQISQTIAEEEVIRDAHISAPTRVRRFLSRFMVVIVVAIAVEGLVAIFKARSDPNLLLYAAAVIASLGLLLTGWGLFIRLNRYAEELEPEAMAEAKQEDHKLKQG
jgi:Ni/Fe-hydrogenase subunit HybB-like protein